ncbi:MAG: MATE family efflux transporter [Lachnospiraceae bacterium]|nr:MATE family efflux transporter [Lachnospiraceae bacterium]
MEQEKKEVVQGNKMGTMPEFKLLMNMSVPMIISMLIQSLYNIVDSIFVAKISENALTAVSLVFPAQSVMIAVATGTGVGVNSLVSRRLGEKQFEDANKTANVSMLLAGLSYLVFLLVGVFGSRFFFAVQTDNAEIISYGTTYMMIVCSFSFGIFYDIMFERLLQATGRSIHTMVMQLSGTVINLVLDPILIFGYLGAPKMGMAGAAVATVAGQIFGMLLGLVFNLKVNKEIRLSFRQMRFYGKIIKEIYAISIPAILMQSIGSVMVFLMNKILLGFTTTATAVFGVYFKLQSFVFMPTFGLNNGLIPIVAYNYGAKKRERMVNTMKYGMIFAAIVMAVGFALAQIIPGPMLRMFDASEQMLGIGIPALRIISFSFIMAGISIVASGVFQAVGRSMNSLVMSIIRQVVVLLPVAWLLARTGNLDAVWLSFPIAEVVGFVTSLVLLRRTMKEWTF